MTTLMLLSYGITVRKSSKTLIIEKKEKKEGAEIKTTDKVSVKQLTGVVCESHVHMTNPARVLLLEHSVPIVLMNYHHIMGITHPFHSHGTVRTRREQFMAYGDERGVALAKAFVEGPLRTKANLLTSYAKNRRNSDPELAEELNSSANEIRNLADQIQNIDGELYEVRKNIMGIEGQGTHLYYQAMTKIIEPEYGFGGRKKRPPKDPVNAALSYGYVILSSRCLIQTVATGLDPYGGYLHVDRSGRPSLAIDLAEEFRQTIVDRAIIELIQSKKLDPQEDFRKEGEAVLLTKKGTKIVIEKMKERLATKIEYDQKHYQLDQIILRQARKVIHFLLGKEPTYKPFISKW